MADQVGLNKEVTVCVYRILDDLKQKVNKLLLAGLIAKKGLKGGDLKLKKELLEYYGRVKLLLLLRSFNN
jgi:hypothetical protein